MSSLPKYRAWHKLAKIMVRIDALDFAYGAYRATALDGIRSGSGHTEDIELLQPTGLKDCKGKDIYESDVVQWEGVGKVFTQSVVWDINQAMFLPNNMNGEVEIIGNIYQHPHLVKPSNG